MEKWVVEEEIAEPYGKGQMKGVLLEDKGAYQRWMGA